MAARRPGDSGQIRIIGGLWRGRKLRFPSAPGLRPTPDRVRETVFNWLAPVVHGARCLDAFAGSGALGLEALSRGAQFVQFIDSNPRCCDRIDSHLGELGVDNAQCHRDDFMRRLESAPAQPFDIVFLDPPFDEGFYAEAAQGLEENGWLTSDAWVYVESRARSEAPTMPSRWAAHREKVMGDVRSGVFVRNH